MSHTTYDLSARPQNLCACGYGYATEPGGQCEKCSDCDWLRQVRADAKRAAIMRDLAGARRAADYREKTPLQSADTFWTAVLVLACVGAIIGLVWIVRGSQQAGNAIASYGAQGWEAGR